MERWTEWGTRLLKVLSLGAALAGSASAFAGGGVGSSGGGKGILCDGRFLRTLDLYEAEEIYGLRISRRYSDLDSNLTEYATRVAAYFTTDPFASSDATARVDILKAVYREVIEHFRDIPLGSSLPLTDDATLPPLPANCTVVQIAIYSDATDTIQRNSELWNKLSVQDQTALILHEDLYKIARGMKAITSDDTRRIVGLVLADTPLVPINQPIFGRKRIVCLTYAQDPSDPVAGTFFYGIDAFEAGMRGVRFYVHILNGMFNMGQTTAFFPGVSIDSIAASDFSRTILVAKESIFNRRWGFEIEPGAAPASISVQAWLAGHRSPGPTRGSCHIQ